MNNRFKIRRSYILQGLTRSFFSLCLLCATLIFVSPNNSWGQAYPQVKSDFEIFLEKLGGSIPFPPEKILQQLQYGSAFGPHADVFPMGRSLERSKTDYEYPRSLVSWRPQGLWGALVYFAYTPLKNQLEIISYNRNTNQNEFQILEDYRMGGNPKLIQPPRGLCTACHQGGNLIFPKSPWSESFAGIKNINGDPNALNEIQEHFRLIKDPFARFVLFPNGATSVTPRIQPEFYERDVLAANSLKESREACNSLCGKDLNCRKKILTIFVMTKDVNFFSKFSQESGYKWETRLHAGGPSLVVKETDSNLLNRNPVEGGQEIKPGPGFDPLTPRKVKVSNQSTVLGLSQNCGFFGEVETEKYSYSELLQLLDSPEISNLLARNWFPDIPSINKALKAAKEATATGSKDQAQAVIVDSQDNIITQPELLDQNRAALPPQQAVIRYCASCHYGAESLAPTLPLTNSSLLNLYKGTAGRKVESLLANKIMPPADSDQPTEKERQLILRWLKESTGHE